MYPKYSPEELKYDEIFNKHINGDEVSIWNKGKGDFEKAIIVCIRHDVKESVDDHWYKTLYDVKFDDGRYVNSYLPHAII